jgi:chromosome segregation ATPase
MNLVESLKMELLTEEQLIEGKLNDKVRQLASLDIEREYTEEHLDHLKKMLEIRLEAKNNIRKREGTIIAQEVVKLNAEITKLKHEIASHETFLTQMANVVGDVQRAVRTFQRKLNTLREEKSKCGKVLEIKKKS